MKPRYKRRIFWSFTGLAGALALCVVIIPPFINLDRLRPQIENVLGIQIDGPVHFSLLGRATIAIHDVKLPNGTVDSVVFAVPLSSVFDLGALRLPDKITVSGARLQVSELSPPANNLEITIRNSIISFLGKDYEITDGILAGGILRGTVRTSEHRYDFQSQGDEFQIRNANENLEISGHLFSDGSARGTFAINTDGFNDWFAVETPKIRGAVKVNMSFEWDGKYGFRFYDIAGNAAGGEFSGEINLYEDGSRRIILSARNINFDLSFLLADASVFNNSQYDLDLSGRLKFAGRDFSRIQINAAGQGDEVIINKIAADDMKAIGGKIGADGASRIMLSTPEYECLFSGTPEEFVCEEFILKDYQSFSATGALSVNKKSYDMIFNGNALPAPGQFSDYFGKRDGKVAFTTPFANGTMIIKGGRYVINYNSENISLEEGLGILNFPLVSKEMLVNRGALREVFADNEIKSIYFQTADWSLNFDGLKFSFAHQDALRLLKAFEINIDTRFLKSGMPVEISGKYKNGNIADLKIEIAGHIFEGSANGASISLKTDLLNLDSFISQDYLDDYEEQQFLSNAPILAPLELSGIRISLLADSVIFSGMEFDNFAYSLRDGSQSFSITDSKNGSLLADIKKNKNEYSAVVQLNKFVLHDLLVNSANGLNISGGYLTADISLATSGKIADDIWHNLSGDLDLSFDGGEVAGLGLDKFYAGAEDITKLNAEYALAAALDGGRTRLKKLRVIGKYENGRFATTVPFQMSLPHCDAGGNLQFANGRMTAQMNLILRGTSPAPQPIALSVDANGRRGYSLSEIMISFDPDYLRDFVSSHDKF
ncbi:MAG: hypothetical protein LBJ18_01015 [Rickettsiales bacterium]|jgi:hypothetical protein|nr:hypothetical protein [Rickettsiales bacterium]